MFHKTLVLIFGAALAAGVMAVTPRARAGEWDQMAKLTFNQPVEMPENRVLPAGTYWFAVVDDTSGSQNIVEVYNADRDKVLGTFLTIGTSRPTRTDDVQLVLAKPANGQPEALVTWFYPDRLSGHEFLYSPRTEAQLSAGAKIVVDAQAAS